jgi:hypothetical protein
MRIPSFYDLRQKQLIVWFFEINRQYFAAVGDPNVADNSVTDANVFVM